MILLEIRTTGGEKKQITWKLMISLNIRTTMGVNKKTLENWWFYSKYVLAGGGKTNHLKTDDFTQNTYYKKDKYKTTWKLMI